MQLLANGTPQGDCVLLNKDGKWQHEFINLPSKDKDGKDIVYTAAELTKKDGAIVQEKGTMTVENQKFVVGYMCKYNVVTITNKQQLEPAPTPEPEPPTPTPEPPAPAPAPVPTPTPEQPTPAPAAPAEPGPEPVTPEAAAPQQAPQRKAIPQTSDATTPMQTQAGALAAIALLLCAFGAVFRVRRSA